MSTRCRRQAAAASTATFVELFTTTRPTPALTTLQAGVACGPVWCMITRSGSTPADNAVSSSSRRRRRPRLRAGGSDRRRFQRQDVDRIADRSPAKRLAVLGTAPHRHSPVKARVGTLGDRAQPQRRCESCHAATRPITSVPAAMTTTGRGKRSVAHASSTDSSRWRESRVTPTTPSPARASRRRTKWSARSTSRSG